MDFYARNEKQKDLERALSVFQPVYSVAMETKDWKEDDIVRFLDEKEVEKFFYNLIRSFNITKHRRNSDTYLVESIKLWNERFGSEVIELTSLLEKYYIVHANGRAIVNPYVRISEEMVSRNHELAFIKEFRKQQFVNPLLQEENWSVILQAHNEGPNGHLLSKEDLIGDNECLYDAIFRNYNRVGESFHVALKRVLDEATYTEFCQRAEFYLQLLVQMKFQAFDHLDLLRSLHPIKRLAIKGAALQFLKTGNGINEVCSLPSLMRLRYVPYEIDGVDIYNPSKDSMVVPFDPDSYNDKDPYNRLENGELIYQSHEFRMDIIRLYPEVKYAFECLSDWITSEEWEQIFVTGISDIYQYYFAEYVISDIRRVLRFKEVSVGPVIVSKTLDLENRHMRSMETNSSAILLDTLQFFLDGCEKDSQEYFEFLIDTYLYFSWKCQYEHIIARRPMYVVAREIIMKRADEIILTGNFEAILLEKLNATKVDDFFALELLRISSESGNLSAQSVGQVIMQRYCETLYQEHFYHTFFKLKGIDTTIQYAISVLQDQVLSDLQIDFVSLFGEYGEKAKKQDFYYIDSKRLRFHLGIIAKYLHTKPELKESDLQLIDYILQSYADIKKMNIQGGSPLDWENMIFDTFSIYSSDVIEEEEILWFHILKVLQLKESQVIEDYLENIKDCLTFTEIVLCTSVLGPNKLGSEKVVQFDPERLSLGLAKKEAYFLTRAGYFDTALEYLEFLQTNGDLNFEEKNLCFQLKYEALVNLERYDEAAELSDLIHDQFIYARKGVISYLKGQYEQAKNYLDEQIRRNGQSKETVINYAAVLVSLGKSEEAVNLCEKYIDEFPNEGLLHANLAIAYKNTNEKAKSIYHYALAKELRPHDTSYIYGLILNLKEYVEELPSLLEQIPLLRDKTELSNQLLGTLQRTTRVVGDITISELELKIISTISKSLHLLQEQPVSLMKYSETEASDHIKNYCKMGLDNFGIEVSRETPQGYASVVSGELDLFFFKSGEEYQNLATGENKEWSPDRYLRQIKQLFGYLRSEGGFGFTIIFNKSTRLQTVLNGRLEKLQTIFESDGDLKPFEKIGPIIQMDTYSTEYKEVLLTQHRNPEKEGSTFRIYHFVLNAFQPERTEVAKGARR